MRPSLSARNLTPNSTALSGPSFGRVGTAAAGQMVQLLVHAVVNVHVTFAASALPLTSLTPVVSVAVYAVREASALPGVNVAMLLLTL